MAHKHHAQLTDWYRAISTDIFKLAEACNFNPSPQQTKLFRAVQDKREAIAVKSGQGFGKSKSTGIIALFRLLQPPKQRGAWPRVIVTAPTMKQCKDVWLTELKLTVDGADPLIQSLVDITKTRAVVGGVDEWGVDLVTATRVENAQGFHRPNMTIIVEEASGVSREIMEQFEGTLTNPNPLIIQIGNPTTRDGYFFDSFYTYGDRWYTLTWSGEDVAGSDWYNPEHRETIAKQFGRDSDVYRVRVLGEFPHTDPNCVISAEDFNRCAPSGPEGVQRMLRLARVTRDARYARQMGLDFARFGGDENVCVRRQGSAVVQWGFWPHTDPNDIVDLAFQWQSQAGWTDKGTQYVADAGGMGQGVMANFHRANKRLFEFHTQAAAFDSQKYGNRMTEAWFCLKERMAEGDCYLPSDVLLQRQMTTRQYYMDRKGRIILETKDDFMKRQGDSPDRADAAVMAFYPLDIGQARIARKDTGHSPTQGYQPKQPANRQQPQHAVRVSRR